MSAGESLDYAGRISIELFRPSLKKSLWIRPRPPLPISIRNRATHRDTGNRSRGRVPVPGMTGYDSENL